MDIALTKKNQSFRLPVDLIERLKLIAKRQNRSLNNYVETILMDVAFNTPNASTLAAMQDAQDDTNLSPVDMSSFDSFLKSLDIK